MKINMFPGQGSQARGMGGDLFDIYKGLTEKADNILGYSIKELCLKDPRNELSMTQFTQPALYVVNALSYYRKLDETKRAPDYLAGHSLGELNALLAAGCFDFETGLRIVQKRGELMGEVSNGGMASVLNASKEEVENVLEANGFDNVYLANYNTPSQIVLSGLKAEIARAGQYFQTGKMRYYPLATSGAFHSTYMQEAMESFREFIQQFTLCAPQIPVIANVSARPYRSDTLRETLAAQIASPVRWCESIQYLMAVASRRGLVGQFEEVGHGEILTRLYYTIMQQTPQVLVEQLAARLSEVEPTQVAMMTGKPSAREKVLAWNRRYPVSSRCRSSVVAGELETSTEAIVLFGHRAAVYMKGYSGYFDLDELVPV